MAKEKREEMTPREQAEQIVKDEYCTDVCDGFGRCCYIMWGSPYECEGFKEEVERCLREWATADAGRDLKESDMAKKQFGPVDPITWIEETSVIDKDGDEVIERPAVILFKDDFSELQNEWLKMRKALEDILQGEWDEECETKYGVREAYQYVPRSMIEKALKTEDAAEDLKE